MALLMYILGVRKGVALLMYILSEEPVIGDGGSEISVQGFNLVFML